MSTSTGKTGRGVTLQVTPSLASPVTWATIANVRSINLSGRQGEEIDFTHLDSTGGYRELRQGFKDGGTINFEMHFDPSEDTHNSSTNGILDLFNDGTVFYWRINFSGAGWAFALQGSGFMINPGDIDINVDGPITGSGSIRNTGATTIVAVP